MHIKVIIYNVEAVGGQSTTELYSFSIPLTHPIYHSGAYGKREMTNVTRMKAMLVWAGMEIIGLG